jgi:mono/diheme cytochrome c family protein
MNSLHRLFSHVACAAAVACAAMVVAAPASAQAPDGRALFLANCATCHGVDGRGMRTPAEVGFDLPMPNFTDCSYATREADGDWSSVIHQGGPIRALVRIMPAFGDALTDDEIDAIIGYIRTFCTDKNWPRGEFNFPAAQITEKAFPEDELVWHNSFGTSGATDIVSTMTFEKRFGRRGQLEVNLPFAVHDGGPGLGTHSGLGDVEVAWKQNVLADVDSGTIISFGGEVGLPTGNERYGLGEGTLRLEPQFLFGQILPDDFFLQGQALVGFPLRKSLSDDAELRLDFGRTFAEDGGFGRAYTPAVELIAAREFASGAETEWDVVPQIQVSLSRLQHVLVSAGARIPLDDTHNRDTQFLIYFIWDWYDGGLFEGW